jgi:uncharacterized integral membrane protein (TIGR00698 family)
MSDVIKKIIFVISLVLCLTPLIDPPLALLLGFIIAQTTGHPFLNLNSRATNWLLKSSVVGLGFGMNLYHAIEAGKDGLTFTVFSILITFTAGWLLGKWLKVDSKTSYLISSGTAICGGSAIAAVAPIIKADEKQMSVALGTVFILNSAALFIFPVIGHLLNMTQYQFGMWSAIAIHDTSSVVGAAAKYGQEALQIATTVKLERALWIIPLSLFTVFGFKSDSSKIKIPYFIGLYILTMCISTFIPEFRNQYSWIVLTARKGLTVTLFLIGAGLSSKTIKAVGVKPLVQGVLLWISIILISLAAIMMTS